MGGGFVDPDDLYTSTTMAQLRVTYMVKHAYVGILGQVLTKASDVLASEAHNLIVLGNMSVVLLL